MAYSCVCVEWYHFEGKCPITSCKFHTEMLDSGCIAIERKDTVGKRFLTDTELKYYKFDNSVSVADVSQYRKKITARVKKVVALYYYTQYILNNCRMRRYVLPESCKALQKKFPFKLSKINITEMLLANMFNVEFFEQYKSKAKLDSEYYIWDVFLMTRKKWEALYDEFKTENNLE